MNQAKIDSIKATSAAAHAVLNAEQARLVEAGLKSKERYELLKPLKASADAAHAEYSKYSIGQIKGELNKIIAAGAPARAAASRSRSAWKQAKFDTADKA